MGRLGPNYVHGRWGWRSWSTLPARNFGLRRRRRVPPHGVEMRSAHLARDVEPYRRRAGFPCPIDLAPGRDRPPGSIGPRGGGASWSLRAGRRDQAFEFHPAGGIRAKIVRPRKGVAPPGSRTPMPLSTAPSGPHMAGTIPFPPRSKKTRFWRDCWHSIWKTYRNTIPAADCIGPSLLLSCVHGTMRKRHTGVGVGARWRSRSASASCCSRMIRINSSRVAWYRSSTTPAYAGRGRKGISIHSNLNSYPHARGLDKMGVQCSMKQSISWDPLI